MEFRAFVAKAPHLTIPRQRTLVYGGKLIFSNAAAKLTKAISQKRHDGFSFLNDGNLDKCLSKKKIYLATPALWLSSPHWAKCMTKSKFLETACKNYCTHTSAPRHVRVPRSRNFSDCCLTLPGRPSTLVGCRPRIDAVLSPVFGKWPPKHTFDERSKNSVVLHPNDQFRALEKPPFWPSFSIGALSFRECPLSFVWRAAKKGGLRDETGMMERCQSAIHSKMSKGMHCHIPVSVFFFTLSLDFPHTFADIQHQTSDNDGIHAALSWFLTLSGPPSERVATSL